MRLADILALRRHLTHKPKVEPDAQSTAQSSLDKPSPSKKVKLEEDEVKKEIEGDEFDAALDDDLDLSSIP